jgi:mannose-6-phosphate isomerase-like protein (cupin superfamily)
MRGYVGNIERETEENGFFRKVLYTAKHCQLVLMSIAPGDDIGEEVHTLDQFLRFESGAGKAVIDGTEHVVCDGDAIIVPAGARHNIINTSTDTPLKLYTIYSPPEHKDGTAHETKADVVEEHFDGQTTE